MDSKTIKNQLQAEWDNQAVDFKTLKDQAQAEWINLTSGNNYWVRVGYGTSGYAAGAKEIFEYLTEKTKTMNNVKVDLVGSLGLSFAEPLVDVTKEDGVRVFYNNVDIDIAKKIFNDHIKKNNIVKEFVFGQICSDSEKALTGFAELDKIEPLVHTKRIATKNCGNISPTDINQYIANGGYEGLFKALIQLTPETILEEVKSSGLRGRGGAAFPTGVKWSFLSGSDSKIKYILCNCEEGDPGAFNDKGILENDPHMLLEGLILSGYATGASNGHVFIREGHEIPIETARTAIKDAYEKGFLGENIMGTGFSFDVEVSLTGDSYVAGEETALMEAIEGKRAMPRFRPPFPAAFGLWGKPSNINNVKTLAYIPSIINNGSSEFKKLGSGNSTGTAIICLSGHIKRPGMYEIEMGMTISELLKNVGGGSSSKNDIKLLQTGGPLGGILGASDFNIKIDFDEMAKAGAILGSGGIIVGDTSTDVVDLVRNLIAFNQFESCGKCFPCRLGNTHMLDILERICMSIPNDKDLDVMASIGNSMKTGSLCGHGQLGYNPISSALKYFKDEFDEAVKVSSQPSPRVSGKMILPTRTRP
tara:strand:- start:3328 stop:5094 length:1767 start_codon:yes stop_codon:yes gene_type:complete